MSRRRKQMSEADWALWRKVASSAKPLSPERLKEMAKGAETSGPPVRPQYRPPARGYRGGLAADVASLKPMKKSPLSLRKGEAAPAHQPIDPKLHRKISSGRQPIEAAIDLHGMTQQRAFNALTGFLARSYKSGLRIVLVITGKGEAGEGVLKRRVPDWLARPELAAITNGYLGAHPAHGGAGALYVRLRRRPR